MALRKAIYAIIFLAIVINAGVAFWEGGFPVDMDRVAGPGPGGLPVSSSIEVPFPGDGDTCTYDHSLGLNLIRTTEDGADSGLYLLDGEQVRRWTASSVERDLTGIHIMSYVPSNGQELTYEGGIDQKGSIERGPDGVFIRQLRGTSLSFDPSKLGPSMDSDIEVTSFIYSEPWEDIIWTGLLDSDRVFSDGDSGSFALSMMVEEADLSIEGARVEWSVTEFVKTQMESWVNIEASVLTGRDIRITYTLQFTDGVPWPTSLELDLDGSYDTEEGPIQIRMALSKNEVGRLTGDREPVNLLPSRPTVASGSGLDIRTTGTVVTEGSAESSFAFTPEEAFEHTLDRSANLQAFMDAYPGSTMYLCEYFRNETGVTMLVWNITLSAGADDAYPGYFFSVGIPERGVVGEKKNLVILQEGKISCSGSSPAGRRSLTLSAHEAVLRGDGLLSEVFFDGDGYVDTYGLKIISRGDSSTPFSAMARHTLGMGSSGSRDLFVSFSQDDEDQKINYISVVDGGTGQLLTRTVETGGYVALLQKMELI
ncbi:MAG: hypothetical protein KAH57_03920 [Thermoplasmata archaeon]|nr:hypothetical protein [Thermoplasmata archaeon]